MQELVNCTSQTWPPADQDRSVWYDRKFDEPVTTLQLHAKANRMTYVNIFDTK